MLKTEDLVDRYVALWNEPDRDVRRKLIKDVWAEDCVHIIEGPEEMRKAARELGFPTATLTVRGHHELETRAAHAYESFIAPGTYAFRSRGNAARLGNIVKFNWEMVSTADGGVAAVGLDVFVLDDSGRITTDYQFIEP